MCRATALAYLGQPDEAYATAQVAMRLNPHHPDWYLSDLGVIRFAQRRYPECLECFGQIPETGPRAPAWKAAAAAHLGRDVEARKHAAAFLANAGKAWAGKANAGPRDYVRWFVRHVPLRLAADQDHLLRGLRKAGLPA